MRTACLILNILRHNLGSGVVQLKRVLAIKRIVLPFILALLLSACGFHLRGMIDMPHWLNNVAIIANDGDKQIASLLKTQLEGYKIDVNPDPNSAKYWLIVSTPQLDQHIVSIGASTNPRQYQLTMTVDFSLQSKKGKVVQPSRHVMVNRQLTVNNDRILGSNEEESLLLHEMRQELVVQIINRLSHKA